MSLSRVRWSVLISLVLLAAGLAYGQIRSSTITGTITDATGGVVAGAEVVATNEETGTSNTTKTTEAGVFTIPYLQAGNYTVAVKATGFAAYRQTGLHVSTAQTARTDVALHLATVGTAVEVSAAEVIIQTDSSTVQSAISSRVIDILPNPTSNPLYYVFLQPGVVPRPQALDTTGISSFGVGTDGRRQFAAVGVNGGRIWTNDIQLDGLPVMGGGYNEAAVLPNTEGLEEVRVIANNFSAQYGHGQAVLSMSTKSGTNAYHGDISYSLRNEALMANSRANKANWSVQQPQGVPRSPFKVNEVGGSVGGPIFKDKLFFFASYHYLRYNRGFTSFATVPTALERVGNFSQTLIRDESGNGVPARIFDPYNVTQVGPNLYQRAEIPNADLSNYPGSQYAKYWMTFYPAPNRTPNDVFNTNNFSAPIIQTLRRHNLNNRIDYRIGKHSIYGSGGLTKAANITPRAFGKAPLNDAASEQGDKNPYIQIGDTIALSPTVVVDVRYGVSRINTKSFSGNRTGFTAEEYKKFGVPENIWPLMKVFGAAPNLQNFGWTTLSSGQYGNKMEGQTGHSASGSITKIHATWTHKFGIEARNLESNYTDFEEAAAAYTASWFHSGGNFNFQYTDANGNSTSQNNLNVLRGLSYAAPFLGTPSWWVRPGNNVALALSQKYMALYTQNDWRATNKLTINLGFRWDLQPGPTDRYNQMSSVDLTVNNPFGSKGAVVFPGINGYSRNMWNTTYTDIGPRFGAAYQVGATTVVRGGFGVTYLPSNSGYFASPVDYGASSFSSGTIQRPYGDSPNGVPALHLWDPHPLNIAVRADPAAPPVYGTSEAKFDRFFKNGRAMQYNFFIEKRMPGNWMASIGYSGSRSARLFNRNFPINSNQMLPADLLQQWANTYVGNNMTLNPATQNVPNPWQPTDGSPLRGFSGSLGSANIQRQITYYPYPLLTGLGLNMSKGEARYNSMQLRGTHQFSRGFHLDLNYTWGKEIDNTDTMEDNQYSNPGGTAGTLDVRNLKNNMRLGGNDIKHRLAGSGLLDLPFGAGKALDFKNRVVNTALAGWQLGSALIWQSGVPIIISGLNSGSLYGHPFMYEGAPLEVPKELQHWYDGNTTVTLPNGRIIKPTRNTFLKYYSGAFYGPTITLPNGKTQAAQNWVGPLAYTLDDFRTPGRFNIDLTVRRNVQIREGLSLEISAEATNALNHTQQSGNYSGGLGSTVVTPNTATGLKAGMGSSDTFGTIGTGTYAPREVVMNLRIRF